MLRQAMGGVELGSIFSPVQMITYSVFVMFYIPCLATLTVLRKELGQRSCCTLLG
jgi:ferrous iron transport protein B